MNQNSTKKVKALCIHSSGCSPRASSGFNLKKTMSTFCSSTRSQNEAKDLVQPKKGSKGAIPPASFQKLVLYERNADNLKINLFQPKEEDLNSKIRNVLTEPKGTPVNKKATKEPTFNLSKKEKSAKAKASLMPARLEKKGIQMNPLSLSNLNELILKEFEMGSKQSHSKRDYDGMKDLGSFPLSARGYDEGTINLMRNRRNVGRKSESGQKLANLCKGTGEKAESKVVKSKVKQVMKGLNNEGDYKSSKVKRYTLTNTSKTEKSINGSTTTKETLPRQSGGEYFTKISRAQKSISPKESLSKIEEKKKMKPKSKNVFGLKNLNLKALSESKTQTNSLVQSISNRQPQVKAITKRQCDTDRPRTSLETAASIFNYPTARSPNDKNVFTSERRMKNDDSEIQSLIDLLEEASREETTVFEASGCQSRKTLKSEQNFDGDNYMNTIISKVQKDFRDSTGKSPAWGVSSIEPKNQALFLINNFCSN